jgi:hypothetical protein
LTVSDSVTEPLTLQIPFADCGELLLWFAL